MTDLDRIYVPALDREVFLRVGTSDRQTFNDTFGGAGGYHVPPADMPVPASVVDLGANIGLTAAHYKALWPAARVVAVEMDRNSASLIELNAPGVVVVDRAVSSFGQWGSYSPNAPSEARQFTPLDAPAGSIRAMSLSLRQIVARNFYDTPGPLVEVDFVKMDVEGMEWSLFDVPSWTPLVRRLLVELHPDGVLHPDDTDVLMAQALERLTAIGFEARPHPPHPRAVYAWTP